MMSVLLAVMFAFSLVCAIATGRVNELTSSILEGAQASIELTFSMAGMLIFWSGIMEIMRKSYLMDKLSKLLTPVIGLLFPSAKKNREIMGDLSANVSANLLGLGNAATPAGIRAAQGLQTLNSNSDTASDALCMLVIINTASLQLVPTTIGAIRAAYGSASPFDIIPAVWVASIISQTAGIVAALLFSKIKKGKR